MIATLGIDLGSTTCKAVLLSKDRKVLGRGITNTRADYRVSADIASREAILDADLALLGSLGRLSTETLAHAEKSLRLAGFRRKLQNLHQALFRVMDQTAVPDFVDLARDVDKALDAADASNGAGSRVVDQIMDRSLFFRDIAIALYLDAARHRGSLDEETLAIGLAKALAVTENTVFSKALDETAASDLPPTVRPLIPKLAAIRPRITGQMGTGYGRALLPFPEAEIRSEILCHGKGARHLFPDARTVLDIGGQDTKAIQLDENGLVASFFMNDRCAAGCGRYLGYVADELGIGLTDLGPLACTACRAVPVTSTCTVFAGTEVRSLLYAGEKREEVLLGLHRAVVLRALSLLARSGGIFDALVFTGGVAQNQAVVRILKEYLAKDHPGITLHIHPDAIYTGALGAALYAQEAL